jgi:hypothetical protein
MIVKICFGYPDYGKYMVCSAKVGRNIKQLQLDFDKWLRNRVENLPHLELVLSQNSNTQVVNNFLILILFR